MSITLQSLRVKYAADLRKLPRAHRKSFLELKRQRAIADRDADRVRWCAIARTRGEETGQLLFESNISKRSVTKWLADHPQPLNTEVAIVRNGEPWPFRASTGPWTKGERFCRHFNHLMKIANRGGQVNATEQDKAVRRLVLAVVDSGAVLDTELLDGFASLLDSYRADAAATRIEVLDAIQ